MDKAREEWLEKERRCFWLGYWLSSIVGFHLLKAKGPTLAGSAFSSLEACEMNPSAQITLSGFRPKLQAWVATKTRRSGESEVTARDTDYLIINKALCKM